MQIWQSDKIWKPFCTEADFLSLLFFHSFENTVFNIYWNTEELYSNVLAWKALSLQNNKMSQ